MRSRGVVSLVIASTAALQEAPERVATVAWANHEVPLALGVVPVGMASANFGDDDGDGMLPWVGEKLDELGGETPVLFDETDGIDFEAVADSDPDVILAAYSGLTQENYDTLSQIAPVVAYPEEAWATSWRDVITFDAKGLGLEAEGTELISRIEGEIDEATAGYPELEGTATMFMTHVDPTDLSTVNFYTSADTRAAFFEDLGLTTPKAVAEASAGGKFSGSVSAEQLGRNPHQGIMSRWSRDDDEAVAAALEATGTLELADRPVDELSGGQRQRVWIAMALAQNTDLRLLDEPTTFLDVAHQVEVLDLLVDLNRDRDRGTTIVMVLHDLNLAAPYVDHLVAIADGDVHCCGAPDDVLTPEMVRAVFGLDAVVPECPPAAPPRTLV